MPFGGETLSSEPHWGGFSQLTYRQSAVKQVLCSLPAICPGRGVWRPAAPCPSQPLLPATEGGSTQRCLPFMGWNLGGLPRGDGVTLSTGSHLLYSCRRAETR